MIKVALKPTPPCPLAPLGETKSASVCLKRVYSPSQDEPRPFLALVARFAPMVMTLLVARATLALGSATTFVVLLSRVSAMTSLLVSAVFVLGPAIKSAVLCWRYLHLV